MTRKFEAGIRFNGQQFKYAKMVFNGDTMTCTVYIDIIRNGVLTKASASIIASQWVPMEDENESNSTLQETRAAKTTAKKTTKESK